MQLPQMGSDSEGKLYETTNTISDYEETNFNENNINTSAVQQTDLVYPQKRTYFVSMLSHTHK